MIFFAHIGNNIIQVTLITNDTKVIIVTCKPRRTSVRIEEFLSRVHESKDRLEIVMAKKSNDAARRRIALTIVDDYLMSGGTATDAYFLESSLYDALKQTTLSCTGLYSEEERLTSLQTGRFKQDAKGSLKLVSEGFENKERYPLVIEIMEVLNGSRVDELQAEKVGHGKGTSGTFKGFKEGFIRPQAEGTSLHRTWEGGKDLPRRKHHEVVTLERGGNGSLRYPQGHTGNRNDIEGTPRVQ